MALMTDKNGGLWGADSGTSVIVFTCSTIGGFAEQVELQRPSISMRIDRAMANIAVQRFLKILVLAAVKSTLEPTRELLNESAKCFRVNPEIRLTLVNGAWESFQSGDVQRDCEKVAEFKNDQVDLECIVLAQASIAAVVSRFGENPIVVLASPELAFQSVVDQFQRQK